MSGILCTWAANIPESSEQWYEDEHIPSMASKFAQHALHCEVVKTGLDDDVDGVEGDEASWKWLTVYEMDSAVTADTYDTSNHLGMIGGLEKPRFNIRAYEEVKRWQQEDWEGDYADVVSAAVMEWQVEEGDKKEVLDFYQSEAAPTIAASPDVLRFRMFKIKNATLLEADSHETPKNKNLHTYLTLVELESEEWPWDVVIALSEKPKWREYFEGQKVVKWQSSHYLVKRSYPDLNEIEA